MITNGKIAKSKKLQEYFKNIITTKLLKKPKIKEESTSPQNLSNSTNIKVIKPKTIAKKLPAKFCKNNLYKITDTEKKLKITEVNNIVKKPIISEFQEKSIEKTKKSNNINISDFKDSSVNSSHCNFILKRGKTKKKNNECLLDYVNRNIKDDNAVLNNPGQFYNGLFNNIMKKVTVKNKRNSVI